MPAHVLIPAADDYEDLELWYPRLRLQSAGHRVTVATVGGRPAKGKHGYPLSADADLNTLQGAGLDGVVVPGGWAPDALRRVGRLLEICRELDERGKLVATICHGGWVLASARVIKGRRLTSTPGIKDDMENAGALWRDDAVVVDGNLITSRRPADLPAFGEALVAFLAR